MKLNLEIINNSLIVTFKGELDHHTASQIRDEIDNCYKDNLLKNIVIDLKNLSFMDSSGIGVIMGRYKKVNKKNGSLCLINANSRIRKILKMSGVLKLVKVYSNLDEAISNL